MIPPGFRRKIEGWGSKAVKEFQQQVKPFWHNTGSWRTDIFRQHSTARLKINSLQQKKTKDEPTTSSLQALMHCPYELVARQRQSPASLTVTPMITSRYRQFSLSIRYLTSSARLTFDGPWYHASSTSGFVDTVQSTPNNCTLCYMILLSKLLSSHI